MYKKENIICGIYGIKSTRDERIYIGYSNNIKKRFKDHRYELKRNNHCNSHLQAFYNKHGKESLQYKIIEECEESILPEREAHWVKRLNSYKAGFNQTEGGEGVTSRGKPYRLKNIKTGVTEEGIGFKKFAQKHNLYAPRISKLVKRECNIVHGWYDPDKYVPKIINVISPDERKLKIYESYEMEFRKTHNLKIGFNMMLRGDCQTYCGWRLDDGIENKGFDSYSLNYHFISPDKKEYKGRNIAKFSEEYGLCFSNMSALMRGKKKQHKGWTKGGKQIFQEKPKGKQFHFLSPQGEKFSGYNMHEFARKHNLHGKSLSDIYKGRRKSHKGWTKYTPEKIS